MEIYYKLLSVEDINKNRKSLVWMLDQTLHDNLTQNIPQNMAEDYVDKLPGYIEDGSAIIVGAFDGDLIVGFLWGYEVNILGERRVHNTEIHVLNSYRGLGIAKGMLEKLEKESKRRGIYILEAMCTVSNESAYRYHIKNGYEPERIKFKKELTK